MTKISAASRRKIRRRWLPAGERRKLISFNYCVKERRAQGVVNDEDICSQQAKDKKMSEVSKRRT
jgi:hypothetical protein